MRKEFINLLSTYKNAFSSDNESLGAIRQPEAYINLNIDIPYPQVLRRPAYPEISREREAFERHIKELIQHGLLQKVSPHKEVEVMTPVLIARHKDKSRIVGDLRELNTYTVPDRYINCIIQENLIQLSKAKYIASMDELKGFHQKVLTLWNSFLVWD
ncbi:hypothetical protein O181_056787 [Austropuccinia psidii MF-1]|uniref:Uncharacterized protein n=1 Tax=Austropuccinia psidii MF-1 TaxID=1389203 RepID=A0A9Q3EBF9_9BASI|nr:hypothetical protein [Austropuccinia psidii MF-1]